MEDVYKRQALLDGENGINTIFHRLRKDNDSKENAIFIATMCASAMTELLSEVSFGNLGLSTKELMKELHEKDSIREVQDFVCMLMDKTLSDVFAGEPVSYTHLDVYKRQQIIRGRAI